MSDTTERHPAQRFTEAQESYANAVIQAGLTDNLIALLTTFDGEPVTILVVQIDNDEYVPCAILLDAKVVTARLAPPEGVEVIESTPTEITDPASAEAIEAEADV